MKVVNIIATLTIIGIISASSLSLVNNWATPKILLNRKAETERSIFLVHPEGKKYEQLNIKDLEVYKVFDQKNQFIGYALVTSGNGFQGKIKIMIGLNKEITKITSIEILDQVETPGLGTKILEPSYKDQYKGLIPIPYIKLVKGTPPKNPNEVKAITGATISSRSVVTIVNDGINKLKEFENKGVIK